MKPLRIKAALDECDAVQDWLATLLCTPDLTHEARHCARGALRELTTIRRSLLSLLSETA